MRIISAAVAILVLVPWSASAGTKCTKVERSVYGRDSALASAAYNFRAPFGGWTLIVSVRGRLTLSHPSQENRSGSLKLSKGLEIKSLSMVSSGPDRVLLAVQTSDGRSTRVHVSALDTQNAKVLWTSDLPVTDVGACLLSEGRFYFSGFAAVGALDPMTGTVLWQQTGLFEQSGFLSFTDVYRAGSRMIFVGTRKVGSETAQAAISFDTRTGTPTGNEIE